MQMGSFSELHRTTGAARRAWSYFLDIYIGYFNEDTHAVDAIDGYGLGYTKFFRLCSRGLHPITTSQEIMNRCCMH